MYDVAIIGGGPAGLSAAVYAARYKMSCAVIAPLWGGFVTEAHLVENWLGDKSVSGLDLSQRFIDHVKSLDVPMINEDVKSITKTKDFFEVTTTKEVLTAKKIILALGTERNKLGVKGESDFLGKGVSYCATCDGFFFRDKIVVVAGSGDAACTGSTFLANIAKKVYLVYRSSSLKAEPIWIDKIKKLKNIESIPSANIAEIMGDSKVEKVLLDNGKTIKTDGVFIEVGSTPATFLIDKLGIKTDEKKYIIVDQGQKTNVEGVFAAGDMTTNSSKFKQIIVAASEGAVAVYNAYIDLKS
ncbi:MAG: FAD-dependent oxidoreductase [bacterium]